MNGAQTGSDVVITGIGLVTSLGLDVTTSCAAARAGIVRAAPLDFYPVRSPDDGSVSGVTAHAVSGVTEGFEGEARLVRLAAAALADLQRQSPEAPWKRGRNGFYVSIPDPDRGRIGRDSPTELEKRKNENRTSDEARARRLLGSAARLGGWRQSIEIRKTATTGSTGVAEATHAAVHDLVEDKIDLAIVAGIESYLDENTLGWLESMERLKSPETPSGLQPGEAAGLFVLETRRSAEIRRAQIFCSIVAVDLAQEMKPLSSGENSTGKGLAVVLESASKIGEWTAATPAWVISDHNGESYRGLEWGNALFRLASRVGGSQPMEVWYPAASFGELGSAFGVAAGSLALRAFARRYAPSNTAALISSSDLTARAVMVLASPDVSV